MLCPQLLRWEGFGMIEAMGPEDLAGEPGWRELEGKLRPFVGRRVKPGDVDDVVQEIFARIQRGLPSLNDDRRFGPWVYQVARSAVVDHLRTATRHPVATEAAPEAFVDPIELDDDNAHRDAAAYARVLVSMLPSPYREALTLTELEGLTQREAAQKLGVSVSGMKSRVQRGRAKIRAGLDACCNIALDARRRVMECEPRKTGNAPDGCCN